MRETCPLIREEEILRNYLALFSWILKLFTVFILVATIHLHKHMQEERELRQDSLDIARAPAPRRPRHVFYRGMGGRRGRF